MNSLFSLTQSDWAPSSVAVGIKIAKSKGHVLGFELDSARVNCFIRAVRVRSKALGFVDFIQGNSSAEVIPNLKWFNGWRQHKLRHFNWILGS